MLDILSVSVGAPRAACPPGLSLGPPGESRRLPEGESPKPVPAQSAAPEDQVVLSGAASPPASPLPVKPNEPVGTQLRVADAVRRSRPMRRESPTGRPAPSADPPEEAPLGRRVDLRA
jgi:hypothetical protein